MLSNLLDKKSKGNTTLSPKDRTIGASVENWRPGDIILDRYRIDDIFSGAMGRVYIAEHLGWKVHMAIKAPKPEVLANKEGIQRILTEANSWVKMGMHPNVATCYYALDIDSVPYLFIEYVDGGDLGSWLKSDRQLDQRTLLSMAIQFCHGMEFTHSKGIIHRDIKPGNILLTKNALLKITDFGIIQTAKEKTPTDALQQEENEATVGFRGTPSYASPEQFRDSHTVDKRSDIFSFGICLWLMFCRHRPFKNNAQAQETPEPLPPDAKTPFPTVLKKLLVKCVAFAPEDRFQSFLELRKALNEVHIQLFKVPCPFMDLNFSDLQAENLNNRAVSLLELGKEKEGVLCLQKALDINDTLQEAIFNYTLLKWQTGSPANLLIKQLEATKKRHPDATMLATLTQAIRCDLYQNVWQDEEDTPDTEVIAQKKHYPEFSLCLPKNSLSVFRSTQLLNSAKESINALLHKKQYQNCYKNLFQIWKNNEFKKDKAFIKTYEKLLLVGSKKKLTEVVRLKTLRKNVAPSSNIQCMPRATKFFSLSTEKKIQVIDYSRPGPPKQLKDYQEVSCMSLCSDGTYMALGFQNGNIKVLPLTPDKKEYSLAIDSSVTALTFCPENKSIIAGDSSGGVTDLNIETQKKTKYKASTDTAVTELVHFQKGDGFISGSRNGIICYWQPGKQAPVREIKGHTDSISILSPAKNNLFFISGSTDRLIKLWNRKTGQCMRTTMVHEDSVNGAIILPDCKHFITTGNDDLIKIWDISTGECSLTLDGRGDGISCITQGPRPHLFLTSGKDGSITIWMAIYELEFS